MLKSFAILAATLVVTAAITTHAEENDLFSRVRAGSAFTMPATPAAGQPSSLTDDELSETLIDVGQLSALLRRAGFEPLGTDDGGVSLKQQIGARSISLSVTMTPDKQHVQIVLPLPEIADPDRISGQHLLKLMDANHRLAPTSFAYDAQQKRLELRHAVENRHLTAARMRAQLERVTAIASQTEALWTFSATSSPAPRPADAAPPVAPAADDLRTRLVGRWSAARSAQDGFALQINQEGTFVLVYVRDGQQSRSTGRFRLEGPVLRLIGSGLTLSGTVSQASPTQFRFQPENSGSPLTFHRAAR